MAVTNSFVDLRMWQHAHCFVLEMYSLTTSYPKHELFGLVSQFRRAAISIPANIAEGYKRLSKIEKLRFFNIAQSSLEECRYYIILSKDLNYIDNNQSGKLIMLLEDTSKSLNSYCEKLLVDLKDNRK
ncbi:MAG: four helix bundle protein [Paludibacter sp.]|nr:four helix bundle protein [Paludibacter sp.]